MPGKFSPMQGTPFLNSSLSYPEGLGGKEQGHYVQFFINEQENANINYGGGGAPASGATPAGGGVSTLSVPRAPTRRLAASISLYMPATVGLQQESKYGEAEIGASVATAIASYKGYNEGQGFLNTIGTTSGALGDAISETGANALKSALDAGAAGAKASQEIANGKVFNNRMEVVFEGISRREFSFTFKMMPKSQNEALMVRQIVNQFRFYMAPSFDGAPSTSRTFIVPATFDIEYHYSGGVNSFLNKISTSVLKTCNVTYGGERVQFFKPIQGDGASPVETQIELNFQELEVITREKINEGF
tara:strand:+ start:65 stop:976 length:912 start_codon:yes stop_codon:yes gene_type:complete